MTVKYTESILSCSYVHNKNFPACHQYTQKTCIEYNCGKYTIYEAITKQPFGQNWNAYNVDCVLRTERML